MTIIVGVICLTFGYWLGGGSPARIAAFAAWIESRPWKAK
jgi:hypothetical protein